MEEKLKAKSKKKKVKCANCYGAGYYSGKFGQTACEKCNTKGYVWK